MGMETFLKVREMGKNLKARGVGRVADIGQMTAPCGLPCFECYLYLAQFDPEMAETIAGVFNVAPDEINDGNLQIE